MRGVGRTGALRSSFPVALVLEAAVGLLASAPAAVADPDCSLAAGRFSHRIEVQGEARRYHVMVGPDAERRGAAPLAFLWHGFGSSARQMAPAFDPARIWKRAIVVAPEGLPRAFPGFGPTRRAGWQIAKGEQGDRDLAFFDALVVDVSTRYCVDRERIYSTGFSNGGFFSNLLACHRADVLAAVAPVSGGGPFPASCPSAVPVRVAHGRSDDVVPYSRGAASFAFWREAAGCADDPSPQTDGCQQPDACTVEVAMCAFDGRHRWPFEDIPALVAFFERHARRAAEAGRSAEAGRDVKAERAAREPGSDPDRAAPPR